MIVIDHTEPLAFPAARPRVADFPDASGGGNDVALEVVTGKEIDQVVIVGLVHQGECKRLEGFRCLNGNHQTQWYPMGPFAACVRPVRATPSQSHGRRD